MNTYDSPTPDADPKSRSSPAMLVIAWLLVGVPLAWGVSQTMIQSASLFRSPSQTTNNSAGATGSAPVAPSH